MSSDGGGAVKVKGGPDLFGDPLNQNILAVKFAALEMEIVHDLLLFFESGPVSNIHERTRKNPE
jgi:hypothetical protein